MSLLIAEGFKALLAETETVDPPGKPVIQMLEDRNWFTVPLEWNTAMKLVELGVEAARIVDAGGAVVMTYPPTKEHA